MNILILPQIRTFALTAGLVAACQTAGAAVISVNFTTPSAGSVNTAAGVQPVANWNNISSTSQTGSSTTPSLISDSGATTAASVTYFNGFYQDGINNSSGNGILNSGYTNTSTTANGTISITGLGSEFTSGGYDVIVYLGGTDGMGSNTPAEFGATLGASTQWIRYVRPVTQPDTFSSTTYATEDLAQASSSSSNYIRFTGLTSANFDLSILKDPDSTANWSRAAVRGIQIVAVPEPSLFALTGLGGLALLRRRR